MIRRMQASRSLAATTRTRCSLSLWRTPSWSMTSEPSPPPPPPSDVSSLFVCTIHHFKYRFPHFWYKIPAHARPFIIFNAKFIILNSTFIIFDIKSRPTWLKTTVRILSTGIKTAVCLSSGRRTWSIRRSRCVFTLKDNEIKSWFHTKNGDFMLTKWWVYSTKGPGRVLGEVQGHRGLAAAAVRIAI